MYQDAFEDEDMAAEIDLVTSVYPQDDTDEDFADEGEFCFLSQPL